MPADKSRSLTILHFNDVYNIEPQDKEPVGGAARFTTLIKSKAHLNPLVLFSGDAFNPSIMSTVTKGKQMVPVLNALNIQCAVYGNHDFDFGVDKLVELAKDTNFPWLMGNVIDSDTDQPLAEGIETHMIEWDGIKIGIVGLVEEEWIDTLSTIDPDDVIFEDYVTAGKRFCQQLKEQGAEFIIALTHMRWPNDTHLAERVDDINLILGGHDHEYGVQKVNGKYVLKSGTDFRDLSEITVNFSDDKNSYDINIERLVVDSSIAEDEDIKQVVNQYLGVVGEKMEEVIGHIEVELDGRFSSIRTRETNLGNFISDIMLKATDSDIAWLNSGTLRSDRVHPVGEFKMKDLTAILPMVDPMVVLKISGREMMEVLENGVSQYPKLEGRFPQVAGIQFGFDPTRPSGSRVDMKNVKIQDEYLQPDKHYRLCTKGYLAEGKDGYDVLKKCEVLEDSEMGPVLSTIVQNHFNSVKLLKDHDSNFKHHQSIVPVSRRRSLIKQISVNMLDDEIPLAVSASQTSLTPRKCNSRAILTRRASIQSLELDCMNSALAPKTEGRIYVIDKQTLDNPDGAQLDLSHSVQELTIQEEPESPTSPTATSSNAF